MRRKIGVIGGNSLVGKYVTQLVAEEDECIAFTRQTLPAPTGNLQWKPFQDLIDGNVEALDGVICVSHIWIAPNLVKPLKALGARKIVAISSTSRFTKTDSGSEKERALARQLEESEDRLMHFARAAGLTYVILRPTLIHGDRIDKNVAEIGRAIERFRFFPVFGRAEGLRQPIHAQDVAQACVLAFNSEEAQNKAYNITGSETLTYREMVRRIFAKRALRPIVLSVPIWSFRLAAAVLRRLPRFRNLTVDMALRMNENLIFSNADARRDFGFNPSGFHPD